MKVRVTSRLQTELDFAHPPPNLSMDAHATTKYQAPQLFEEFNDGQTSLEPLQITLHAHTTSSRLYQRQRQHRPHSRPSSQHHAHISKPTNAYTRSSTYTAAARMLRTHVILLILFLTALFACLFGWGLFKCCRRSIDAKFHEMQCLEMQGGEGSKKSGSGKGEGSKKSGEQAAG